jgi:hypothetical protein
MAAAEAAVLREGEAGSVVEEPEAEALAWVAAVMEVAQLAVATKAEAPAVAVEQAAGATGEVV